MTGRPRRHGGPVAAGWRRCALSRRGSGPSPARGGPGPARGDAADVHRAEPAAGRCGITTARRRCHARAGARVRDQAAPRPAVAGALLHWLAGAVSGDLGTSIVNGQSVTRCSGAAAGHRSSWWRLASSSRWRWRSPSRCSPPAARAASSTGSACWSARPGCRWPPTCSRSSLVMSSRSTCRWLPALGFVPAEPGHRRQHRSLSCRVGDRPAPGLLLHPVAPRPTCWTRCRGGVRDDGVGQGRLPWRVLVNTPCGTRCSG